MTAVAATLAGPLGVAAVLAAPGAPPGPIQTDAPASAVALAVIGLAILALLVVVARRYRQRTPSPVEEVSIVLPASLSPIPDLDLDFIVSGARAQVARVRDGRGSEADDRSPDEPGQASGRPAGAPVWVRRLDDRIPIMPTHQNVPVDNEELAGRPRRGGMRRTRGRGRS